MYTNGRSQRLESLPHIGTSAFCLLVVRILALLGGEEAPLIGGIHVGSEHPLHIRCVLFVQWTSPDFVYCRRGRRRLG